MRINLINNGGSSPIASGQKTKLDRERRPTVSAAPIQQGINELAKASKGTRVSEELAAPSQALVGLGRDVERAGGIMLGVQLKRDAAIVDFQSAEADTKMREAMAEQLNWQRLNPDPTTWDDRWQQKLTALGGALANDSNLTEKSKAAIALRFQRFQGTSKTDIALQSTKQSFNLAASAGKANLMRLEESQDADAYEAELARMEGAGYLYPHEAEGARQRFARTGERIAREAEQEAFLSDREAFATMVEADPWAAYEAADDELLLGSFDGAQRRAAKAQAERAIVKEQSKTVEAIRNGVVSGEMTEKDIDDLGEMSRLGAESIAGLKKFREDVVEAEANSAPMDYGKAIKLKQDIREFNEKRGTMEEAEAIAAWGELHARIPLDAAGKGSEASQTRGQLSSSLYQAHPFVERRPPETSSSGAMRELKSYIDIDEKAGNYGELKNAETGEINREVGFQAVKEQEALISEFEKVFQANPTAFEMPGSIQSWYEKKRGISTMAPAATKFFDTGRNGSLFPQANAPRSRPANPDAEIDERTRDLLDYEAN